MENPQDQKAFDSAEHQAHRMEHSRSPEPEMGQPISSIKWPSRQHQPPEFQIVARIKNGMKPDGTFQAKTKCGAEISLHADDDDLVLIIEGQNPTYRRVWNIPK